MAIFQFKESQIIRAPREEVWQFIATPANLAKITPKHMGFDIQTPDLPSTMYPGMIIQYKVKPLLGIPLTWLTEITHVEEHKFFIDVQRSGPYAFWHHQHFLAETAGGVRMDDIVTYQPPFGFLGTIANELFIRNQLKGIFEYRRKVLDDIFNRQS
ncbi:SRPBCC family protein [Membranicola marinus]|uniref:SRPBCC family protein n=1 Tax=Membranihabitans marinus TaxID=1227546 RepID=A0A953HQ94_9BACT|nr:SRPBCC family protein [Membranihabitans marinus]MBY5960204.1 SRPBCC family protein [Membranihabitans marinus]